MLVFLSSISNPQFHIAGGAVPVTPWQPESRQLKTFKSNLTSVSNLEPCQTSTLISKLHTLIFLCADIEVTKPRYRRQIRSSDFLLRHYLGDSETSISETQIVPEIKVSLISKHTNIEVRVKRFDIINVFSISGHTDIWLKNTDVDVSPISGYSSLIYRYPRFRPGAPQINSQISAFLARCLL
jgi:hypothetical protein